METVKILPKDAYEIGKVYDFIVKQPYSSYCELIDPTTGLTTYLQGTTKLKLFKKQPLKCRVTEVTGKHPRIELVNIGEFEEGGETLTETKLENLLNERQWPWNMKDFIDLLLTDERETSFDVLGHRWIQSLLGKKADLMAVRRECSDLLELSDLLNQCGPTEREFYQERLTRLIERIGYYIKAEQLIENEKNGEADETPDNFIDTIFHKLKVSGFVYHPEKNFNILSSLFLRRPDLMHSRIEELTEIIKTKDLRIWEKEPFRTALILLLELYIIECKGTIGKTKDNGHLAANNLTALAIQLLLTKGVDDATIFDEQLNAARLCTVASYNPEVNPEELLEAGYHNLFNSEYQLPAYRLDNLRMLPHYLANMETPPGIDTVNTFVQNNIKLTVSPEGVTLQPHKPEGDLYPVFPAEMNLWKGMQVRLGSRMDLSAAGHNNLKPYRDVWKEIEAELFNRQISKPKETVKKNKKRHKSFDQVRISIRSQDEKDPGKFYCQIEDEIGGEGYIYLEDIVPYQVSGQLRHFQAPDGRFLVFEAEITEVSDGEFRFSMRENVKNRVSQKDFYSEDEDIICAVGSNPNVRGEAPAISREGASVTLRNAHEFNGIERGVTVECSLVGKVTNDFHIQCDIEEIVPYTFSVVEAFTTLMRKVAVDCISEPEDGPEEQMLTTDRLLDEAYVRELIYMIDRMAILDGDYMKSYNYLAFARILCMLLGREAQAAYYKGRMDIIALLHDFAIHNTVDAERVDELGNVNPELFNGNGPLKERFMQLQTISYLDKPDRNPDLFDLAQSNSALAPLASLCLAYNITKEARMIKASEDIHNRIKGCLNLKGYESGLKKYGKHDHEDGNVEFKTSIVYSADKDSKGPDPERQMKEILRVINAFLNSYGGTLYIGVNDAGLGVGLEEDLEYYKDNKDKYIRDIMDAVAMTWGNPVLAAYIESVAFDEDNKDKDVVAVKVRPMPQGVPFEKVWWVRKEGSKRGLDEKGFEEYQKVRHMAETAQNEPPTEKSVPAPEERKAPAQTTPQVPIPSVKKSGEQIATSRIRRNVLEEYMDNYVTPVAYLRFADGNKFMKLDDWDYDYDAPLTLVLRAEEENGYLVLGYENGGIVKVPVRELLDFQDREYPRYGDSKLIFATLASDDDILLTISKENKSRAKAVVRGDTLSKYKEGRLMDSGEVKIREDLIGKVLAFEVVPAEYKGDFGSITDKKDTFAGTPDGPATKAMINRLHLWGVKEI